MYWKGWEPTYELQLVGHPGRPGSHKKNSPKAELTFYWKSFHGTQSFSSDFCILPFDVSPNVKKTGVFFTSVWLIFCQITCHCFCTSTILYLSVYSTKYSFWRAFLSAHLYIGKLHAIYCTVIELYGAFVRNNICIFLLHISAHCINKRSMLPMFNTTPIISHAMWLDFHVRHHDNAWWHLYFVCLHCICPVPICVLHICKNCT